MRKLIDAAPYGNNTCSGWNLLWPALLLCAAGLGLWARFHALGASALAVDEYYLFASARNVLDHGVPQFACGGYYLRGLLHQYFSAGLVAAGISPETAIRLPAALASLVAVGGAWLLARFVGGWRAATFVAALLLLSVWQVEFARFGRMYAPFQACTVFYALAALKFLESGERRHFGWLIALGFGTVLVHEGGAILAMFTLLALLLKPARVSSVQVGLAVVAALAAVALTAIDFRSLGAVGETGEGFSIPWPLALGALAGVGAAAALLWWRFRHRPLLGVAAWVAVVLAMAGGFFLLAAILLAAAVLFSVIDARTVIERRTVTRLVLCVALFAGLWALYALVSPDHGTLMDVAHRALRYPDLYMKVWAPWSQVLPYLGIAIAAVSAGAGIVVLFFARDAVDLRFRVLLGITLALLTAAAVSPQPYYQTRYTFFLYPLFLILLVQGAAILARRFVPRAPLAVAVVCASAVFVASADFNLRHLLHVADPAYLYRTAYSTRMANHLYPRWDYRGMAQAVTARAKTGDLVLTTAYPVMPYYSPLFETAYVDKADPRLKLVSACRGQKDIWGNLPLVSDPEQLRARIEKSAAPVWLVVRSERYSARRPVEAQLQERYGANEVYRSVDGNLALLRAGGGAP